MEVHNRQRIMDLFRPQVGIKKIVKVVGVHDSAVRHMVAQFRERSNISKASPAPRPTRKGCPTDGQMAREWSPCGSHQGPGWGPRSTWRPWKTMWSCGWRPTTLMGGMCGSKMGPLVLLQRWRRTGWAKPLRVVLGVHNVALLSPDLNPLDYSIWGLWVPSPLCGAHEVLCWHWEGDHERGLHLEGMRQVQAVAVGVHFDK